MNVCARHVDRVLSPASVDYPPRFCLAGCPVPEQAADCRLFVWVFLLLVLVLVLVLVPVLVACLPWYASDHLVAGRRLACWPADAYLVVVCGGCCGPCHCHCVVPGLLAGAVVAVGSFAAWFLRRCRTDWRTGALAGRVWLLFPLLPGALGRVQVQPVLLN